MDTDRNLLFGVLALQADLIDTGQFVEACTLWATRKHQPLAELLVDRGWLVPADRAHLDYLLQRKLGRNGGDVRASLAGVPDDIKRSLAALGDADIQQSLAGLPGDSESPIDVTVDHVPKDDRYELTRLHATGGIGRVWLARDRDMGRNVALKELRPERAGNAQLCQRFLQEARITGQLEHPGIVPVYELGRHAEQQPFYTMRFVKGRTLSEAARAYHQKRLAGNAEPLDLLTLLNAFVTVCNTVAYAHSRGVIHRDLKGQNVILGDFGEVVVLDWGLAKLVSRAEVDMVESILSIVADSSQTMEGQAIGTPAYMAPEQAMGRLDLIDRRTDVYGLGAILYEILTGGPPFSGSDTQEVLRKVREDEPVRPSQLVADVPPALEVVCLRALAKSPTERYASASEPARQVQIWQEVQRRQAEEALQRQTEILKSILNSMSDGVIVADETAKFLLWNPAAERFLRRPGENVRQARWTEYYGCYRPDKVTPYPAMEMPLSRAIRGEEVDEAEVFIRHDQLPQGIVLSINARPLKDKDGKQRGGVIVFRDVTARKLAEEELRKSRERFELAVQGSQDGLWDWDVETNEVWYSPHLRNMLGYSEQEYPNLPGETEKRVHPDDRARWRAALYGHIEGVTDHFEGEYRIQHKDGSYRWVRDRGVALRHANGKAYRMAGSREDVTERKTAEDELAHERHLLRSLLVTSPDKIYFKDRDGHYVRVNKALADTFGLSDPDQVVGKTVHDIFTPEYARQTDAEEREIMRTGQPQVAKDIRETWPDGRVTWESTTKLPLRNPNGEIIGTIGISRNIAERKQADEALRQSEERYRSVVASMQDGILLLDADGGIQACNAAAERIFGLPAEQMLGRTSLDRPWHAIHEDGSPFPVETYPAMVTLRTGQPCTDIVMGVPKPDGRLTWISVNSQPLYRADNVTLAGVVTSFEDISERKRVEELLRQCQAELAACKQQLRQLAGVREPGAS